MVGVVGRVRNDKLESLKLGFPWSEWVVKLRIRITSEVLSFVIEHELDIKRVHHGVYLFLVVILELTVISIHG